MDEIDIEGGYCVEWIDVDEADIDNEKREYDSIDDIIAVTSSPDSNIIELNEDDIIEEDTNYELDSTIEEDIGVEEDNTNNTEDFTIVINEGVDGNDVTIIEDNIIQEADDAVTVQHLDEDNNPVNDDGEYLVGDEIIPSTVTTNALDQLAAENLIYMAHDANVQVMGNLIEQQVEETDAGDFSNQHEYFECQVTEEVITGDWVQHQGEDRVEIPVEQLGGDFQVEEDVVPLPTIQDEYTALRPYPCDFCSRRFRKKANLMNHMVAHKNDRPHICNLCGARYVRRIDLLNHLKIHAQLPEDELNAQFDKKIKRKPGRQRKSTYSTSSFNRLQDGTDMPLEEVKMLIDAAQRHESLSNDEVRYPVIDDRKPFVCQKCGVCFAREKALLSHTRQMHGGDSPYECDNCSEMFWDVTSLRDHQRLQHAGHTSNSEYEPDNEKDNYSDSDVDSKYGDFFCDICGMAFHRQDLLKRHIKKHGKQDFSFDSDYGTKHCCNVCGENFSEALDLLAHAEIHARNQPFKCMLCGETFLEELTIKKHLNQIHYNEMSETSCRLCGKQCRDAKSLIKHAWDHSREKNHSCSKCGKTFHNKARLKRHMQSHRNKSVTCEVCCEEFPDGRSLMNHRHSHSNTSGKQFPCKECGKTFGSRSSQQIHMRIHTGEKPYGCKYCWKAFADGGTLRKHERIHTGEKPYACPICPRAFNQRVVLREHVRSHHSGPDAKHGTATTPYYCVVCSELFTSSMQLIQHIIEHSDMNTAMKRKPPTGPRKYKRRRKLKPHELERYRALHARSESEEDENDEDDMDKNDNNNNKSTENTNEHNENDKISYDIELSVDNDEYSNSDDNADNDDTIITTTTDNLIELDDHQSVSSKREHKKSTSSTDNEEETDTILGDNNANHNNSLLYGNDIKNVENTLQSFDSLITEPTKKSTIKENTNNKLLKSIYFTNFNTNTIDNTNKKPKMIHTQKTRVSVEDGKRKTRTLVTSTSSSSQRITFKNQQRNNRIKTTKKTLQNYAKKYNTTVDRSYKRSQPVLTIKQEDIYNRSEADILLELSKKNLKYSPEVVNDLEEILRSPIRPKESIDNTIINPTDDPANQQQQQQQQRKTSQTNKTLPTIITKILSTPSTSMDGRRISKRILEKSLNSITNNPDESDYSDGRKKMSKIIVLNSPINNDDELITPDEHATCEIKIEIQEDTKPILTSLSPETAPDDDNSVNPNVFICGICSVEFNDRAELLLHVPIHI